MLTVTNSVLRSNHCFPSRSGDDRWGYEKASERWLPVHTVETILVSVISMLADPNDESPANVDAAKEWRENFPEFKRKVAKCVRKSQEDLL